MKSYPFRSTNPGWLGFLLPLLLAAAACSGASATGSPHVSATAATSTSGEPNGLTSLSGNPSGDGSEPTFRVEAPNDWSSGGFYVGPNEGGGWLAISVWDVQKVPQNPCHSIGHLTVPGPTVDDLVAALEAQSLRHATRPTDVTLAGYSGKYLEWSVPSHWKVKGQRDFAGCDVQDDGHRYFTSWYDNADGERYQQGAGQVDRLWILNVKGHRLVVDATHSPNATQVQLNEENRIVHSLEFVPTT